MVGVGLFVGIVILGGMLIYENVEFDRLKERYLVQGDKNKTMATKLAAKEVELQVMKNSELVIRETLQAQNIEIVELEKLVDFYRQLMAPSDAKSGLDINSYKLEALNAEGLYAYKLTFVQYSKKHRVISADIHMMVEGVKGEQLVTLNFSELVGKDDQLPKRLRFKYFQVLEGELQLPSDFKPQTLKLKAKIKSKKPKQFERQLPWDILET
jgi:hypothetical protein